MNIMKLALLGTAAVAAVSVSARADDLSDMKAQIEALNSRLAQVEAAPAVPAGYSLLSVSSRDAVKLGLDNEKGVDRETVISIMPTADMPAGTELSISGEVRAALVYTDTAGPGHDLNVKSRGGITVGGSTETAVGKVGAKVSILDGYDTTTGSITIGGDGYWGYWQISPELTLGGGRDGSVSGLDGQNACTCYYNGGDVGFGRGDPSQMRLSYASGPISFAIALEDASRSEGTKNSLGVAAEVKWSADMVSFEVAGGAWDKDHFAVGDKDASAWQVGAGVGFNMDMISFKAAAATGDTWGKDKYWKASALASVTMSDSVSAEVGVGFINNKKSNDSMSVLGGIYYAPVDKLKIGLEAGYVDPKGAKNNSATVDLVTIYKF
jgi:hypothetical protein